MKDTDVEGDQVGPVRLTLNVAEYEPEYIWV